MLSYKRFLVFRKVKESDLVVSLYLKPLDDNTTAVFKPGQHLMFKIRLPGHEIPAFRYYSFSDSYNPDYYRVSVKKELAPASMPHLPDGYCSSYVYDVIREGDVLEAKGPTGDFFLNPKENEPLVLIAGGIGITPLLSMIRSIARENPTREAWFFYGVNEKKEHAFFTELEELKKRYPNFYFNTFYTRVQQDDVKGYDYDYEGFLKAEIILQHTRNGNIPHYICGPDAMIRFICPELIKRGVAPENIKTETFAININGASLDIEEKQTCLQKESSDTVDIVYWIDFAISGKKLNWDNRYKSILELAEANDIEIPSGCLFGDCGTCLTKIIEGGVKYIHQTLVKPNKETCLPCSCVPVGNLVLKI